MLHITKRKRKLGDPCRDCKTPLTESNCHFKGNYLQTICKVCEKKRDELRPSRQSEARSEYYVNWKFNVSKEQFDNKLEIQNGGCEICRQPNIADRRLAVDHNHQTNEVRGLLCHTCNAALGFLKEDENLIWNMLDYIKKYNQKKVS